jgi:predicted metal-dependent hydrolase
MSINKLENETNLIIRDIPIQIVRKSIKNLHIGVYPPDGYVRVAAPLHLTDDNIRLAIVSRLSWIKKQQTKFQEQPRESKREMVAGESHYIFGHQYRMEVIERPGSHEVVIINNSTIQLFVNPGTSPKNRALVLTEWYREQLKSQIPDLLNKWQSIIGEQVADWGIKKMKTKWGSCNIKERRIWLNLELAKKPIECLEYVLVHELVHLLEKHHNERFQAYMDKYLPQWRQCREILNREPLGDI